MKKYLMFLIMCLTVFLGATSIQAKADEKSVMLPILMYHHISNNPAKWNDYVISLDEFKADMDYLKENGWQSISVHDLLDWYEGDFKMPEKPFILTFDDGFESTEAYAEPIVEEHGFTGVVAIIGSVCEKFSLCNEHDPELSNLSWEDAAAMAERGVMELQCHTWDMHSLNSRQGCNKLKGESVEGYRNNLSKDLSRFLTGCKKNDVNTVLTIAYPFGAFCRETTDVVKDMGFLAAFTCENKINILTGDRDELYNLCRYNRPHGKSSENFFKKWEENS